MYSIALFPLGLYFFLLAWFYARNRPTVLTGVQDLMLLSCGLYGMFVAGPGRLMVPVFVWTYWDFAAWVYLTSFYFVVVYLVAVRLTPRVVVYRCNNFVSKLVELGKDLDPQVSHAGNVLTLPGMGVQLSIRQSESGACTQLEATGPMQNVMGWKNFVAEIRRRNQDASNESIRSALKYLFFAVACLVVAAIVFQEAEAAKLREAAQNFLFFDLF